VSGVKKIAYFVLILFKPIFTAFETPRFSPVKKISQCGNLFSILFLNSRLLEFSQIIILKFLPKLCKIF
jgi:hypothetical protein